MAEPAKTEIRAKRLAGMISNQDAHDLEPGQSVLQMNMTAVRTGELNIRPGLVPLTFDVEA